MEKVLIVIPARYASSRFPGKPLVELQGVNGAKKTLIERSWNVAKAVCENARIVVATDDVRISRIAEGFGAEVVMTSDTVRNGTERCAETLSIIKEPYDIVVNLQGDAPLTPPWFLEALIVHMVKNHDVEMCTPVLRCTGAMRQALIADRRSGRVGGTTAIFNTKGRGLYFSKEVIPFSSEVYAADALTPVFHHVGVYAYRPAALAAYPSLPVGNYEKLEGLEQLRFIENNLCVACVEVDACGKAFWELNNPEDTVIIEEIMRAENIE